MAQKDYKTAILLPLVISEGSVILFILIFSKPKNKSYLPSCIDFTRMVESGLIIATCFEREHTGYCIGAYCFLALVSWKLLFSSFLGAVNETFLIRIALFFMNVTIKIQIVCIMVKLYFGKNGVDMVIALCPFVIAAVTSVGFVVYSAVMLPCKVTQVCLKTIPAEELHLSLQVILMWIAQFVGLSVLVLNTGLVGSKSAAQPADQETALNLQVYRDLMLACAAVTTVQIVHFLCCNLRIRVYVREWCFAQYDMADLEATRLLDQSNSRLNLNESKSDTLTKKIKVKYPLFLTKQQGNMFRRAERSDVKTQVSARTGANPGNQISLGEKTKSAVFVQRSSQHSQRDKKKDQFESSSAIVITEGNRDEIVEQFVAKIKVESPMSSARYRYTVTQGDVEDEPKQEVDIPQLPDDALDDDSLCTICYSQKSNTVLLDCGHGGICIDCATDTMKKNNHCLFCRARVV